jgi:hypothetical protein
MKWWEWLFVLAIAAALGVWVIIKVGPLLRVPPGHDNIGMQLRAILLAAERLRAETGRYPEDLDELAAAEAARPEGERRFEPKFDPWKRPYILEVVDGRPRARCLGHDGRPGGEGEDEDEDREVAGPLWSSRSGKSQR